VTTCLWLFMTSPLPRRLKANLPVTTIQNDIKCSYECASQLYDFSVVIYAIASGNHLQALATIPRQVCLERVVIGYYFKILCLISGA